jgi:hypothetical protein
MAAQSVRVRHERAIETVRHTVVRGEPAPRGAADRAPADARHPGDPLLLPAVPVIPGPRPALAESTRPERPGAAAPADRGDASARTLNHIGDTHHAQGDPDSATTVWQRALTILDELDHPDTRPLRKKIRDSG